jgi:hypothetical protein
MGALVAPFSKRPLNQQSQRSTLFSALAVWASRRKGKSAISHLRKDIAKSTQVLVPLECYITQNADSFLRTGKMAKI